MLSKFTISMLSAAALLAAALCPALAQERTVDAAFKPVLVKAELGADQVRPGDTLPLTLRFRNEGTAPAAGEYPVFVHLEPAKDCEKIAVNLGHAPTVPTTQWRPGKEVVDGPQGIAVPSDMPEGSYWLHVGLYQWEPVHVRFCEEYVQQVKVTRSAPPIRDNRPPLSAAEVARRRAALAATLKDAPAIESAKLRLRVDPATGAYALVDKASGVVWHSHPFQPRFGEAVVRVGERTERLALTNPQVTKDANAFRLTFRGTGQPAAEVAVRLALLPDGRTLEISCETPMAGAGPSPANGSPASAGTEVQSIRLLDEALWVTDADQGAVLVPTREGLLVPANSGRIFQHSFPTSAYEGCHMQMLGILKEGSAALVTWEDPYVTAELHSSLTGSESIPGRQVLSPSLVLRRSAKTARVQFLGKGDAVTIARAYREVARQRGLLQTWAEKIARNPDARRLLGAANIKLWSTLSRSIGPDGKERSATVNWTFDEAAQVAEHMKNDLKLDRVLFTLGGWVRRGYDNQHPDILPTAPECGGDEKFVEAVRRIKATGFLLGLHDNYQDIYRDSPSWDESLIMKNPRGDLVKGGNWAGGQAYLTCSKQAVGLAKRPQNLPGVFKLSGPAAYFIDTTFAAGPCECFDPQHPLTYADDIKYKCDLADYARQVFGLFGSECGREWAIPHADFFEGLAGVSGTYYHDRSLPESLGATVIPLFEMVYRDCIAMYGKYGYDPARAAGYVLHHLNIGRPLNYHSIPAHLYWQHPVERPLPVTPAVAEVEPAGARSFRITYAWKVAGPVAGDWRAFVHFTDAAGNILFQDDYVPEPATSKWQPGEVRVGPHTLQIPEGAAGPFYVQMGLFRPNPEVRAALNGRDTDNRSYRVGTLRLEAAGPQFAAIPQRQGTASAGDAACFTRADGGWAEGMHPLDAFIKNTYEVLSPLNEITAEMLVTKCEFLTPDRRAQRTTFGGQVVVTTNDRQENLTVHRADGREVVLPPYGFLVESPQFVAFHALNWGTVKYERPVLFTLRSRDGQPLARSRRVRVFHGFGDARCEVGGRVIQVAKEAIIP